MWGPRAPRPIRVGHTCPGIKRGTGATRVAGTFLMPDFAVLNTRLLCVCFLVFHGAASAARSRSNTEAVLCCPMCCWSV